MWNSYKIVFRGRVQRVRYKRYMSDLVQELGLVEYIRNLEDMNSIFHEYWRDFRKIL